MDKEEIYEIAKERNIVNEIKCVRRFLSDNNLLLWYHRQFADETIRRNQKTICHPNVPCDKSPLINYRLEGNMVKVMAEVARILDKYGATNHTNAVAFDPINYKINFVYYNPMKYYEENYMNGNNRDT